MDMNNGRNLLIVIGVILAIVVYYYIYYNKSEENTKAEERSARFVCSVVIVSEKGEILFSTTQTCEGQIAFSPTGYEGFGYDPIFYLPEKNATMAELTMEEKNKLSHRSKAFKKAMEWLLRS